MFQIFLWVYEKLDGDVFLFILMPRAISDIFDNFDNISGPYCISTVFHTWNDDCVNHGNNFQEKVLIFSFFDVLQSFKKVKSELRSGDARVRREAGTDATWILGAARAIRCELLQHREDHRRTAVHLQQVEQESAKKTWERKLVCADHSSTIFSRLVKKQNCIRKRTVFSWKFSIFWIRVLRINWNSHSQRAQLQVRKVLGLVITELRLKTEQFQNKIQFVS